jgi:hypothetical protein
MLLHVVRAEGREIMTHSYSPSPRQLAVPGIGFPQNISVGSDVLDPAAFRDWSDDRFDAPSQPIDRIAWLPCRGHGLRPDGDRCGRE